MFFFVLPAKKSSFPFDSPIDFFYDLKFHCNFNFSSDFYGIFLRKNDLSDGYSKVIRTSCRSLFQEVEHTLAPQQESGRTTLKHRQGCKQMGIKRSGKRV